MTDIFDKYSISGLDLPNRIVMAPMTRVRSDAEGLANSSMAKYYAQRATAGLIVSEGIQPSLVGQSNPLTPGLHTDDQTESWRQVTSAVHTNGGRIFAQIMHGGRISHPATTQQQPVAPSPIAARDAIVFTPQGPQPAPVPRELSTKEVAHEAQSYASAAVRARTAGFDGVELHGANGYLIGQFLSSNANLRSDRYGGAITGRIRFALEAVEATADAIGAQHVGIRLSPGAGIWDAIDTDVPDLYGTLLTELAHMQIAYVHLEATTDEDTLVKLRHAWPWTMIVNPSDPTSPVPTDRKRADHWLDLGADLVSFGRAFLANPDLVERLRADLPLAESDVATYYQGGDDGYITYRQYQH